ncbi:ABC transporter substrate-binding protein [Kitasatospora sp. NPDC057223]|uniref:ABC transporter substrate-binding protein n=1 Tax=Kitasatospora sp. NPDC057223 TaxID=3346055 RepID=UPI0036450F19
MPRSRRPLAAPGGPEHTRRAVPGLLPGTALALALALAGCAPGTTGAAAGAGGDGPPRAGGTLSVDIASKPLCLDPQNNNSNGNTAVSRQLVDSLTDQDPATGQARPWLASSFEVNDTATEFTFKLRSGATFSDGQPVDAAAVKANFDTIVKLGAVAAVGSSYLADYTGTTVLDASTARVTFSQPNAQFLQATSTAALGLLSPASLAGTPQDRCQGRGLAGSGPFTLKAAAQGEQIQLVRRADYAWGSSLWKHQGAAHLDGIDYKVVPESGVQIGSLLSGQVDAVIGVQAQDEKQLADGRVTLLARPVPGVSYNLTANTTNPVLADENVRTALTRGIDRAEVVSTLLSPNYKPATSVLSSTTPLYADLSADLSYDPDRARKLLDAAGWAAGGDGVRSKDGAQLKVKLLYPGVDTASRNVLQLVQQQLAKIGVKAELAGLPLNELAPAQAAGTYDLLWFGLTRADPDVLRTAFATGAKNRARLAAGNELDTLLTRQAATVDQNARRDLAAAAQKLIVQKAYSIPVYEQVQAVAFTRDVHGAALDGSAQPEFYDTWLSR